MDIPPEYHEREQSYLKHRVLQEYLALWGRKIGSLSKRGPVTLWYVDCFAGPWRNKDDDLTDTSIHIGLSALEEAGRIWRENGHDVRLRAVFVESDPKAYRRLEEYLRTREGEVKTHPFQGEFGSHVDGISTLLGDDPAFIFVDPTGFKGVAMDYIRPLLEARMREVLVNVMFNHINRFKDDSRAFLRAQMKAFFGLSEGSLAPGLSEVALLQTYRKNLKARCHLEVAADLAVPHPTKKRTWFRLVIGGKHREVIKVFREVEARVMGREASSVRKAAQERKVERETGQISLFVGQGEAERDPWYARENEEDQVGVIEDLLGYLRTSGPVQYGSLWPMLLEERHVTESELGRLVVAADKEGRLVIEPPKPRRRKAQDDDFLVLVETCRPRRP